MGAIEGTVDLQEEIKDDVLVLRIKGRLDAISSPLAEKTIFNAINGGQIKVIFDFSGVSYLSSAGMRMLLSTTKKLRTLSGHLVVCCVMPNVMDVLKMSGFDHVLDLSVNEKDALQRLSLTD